MSYTFCGIDFGTSNSSVAVAGADKSPLLVPVENGKPTIPSTVFYAEDEPAPLLNLTKIKNGNNFLGLKQIINP